MSADPRIEIVPLGDAALDQAWRSWDPPGHADPVDAAATRMLAWRGARPAGRCTLQVVQGLRGAPGSSGLIGHYEATDSEAGAALLAHAAASLAQRGVARVLGPMNGSTWRRYRLALASEPGDALHDPPFFLGEPRNPFDYPEHFRLAGFEVAARYESGIDLAVRSAGAAGPIPPALAERGIRLRDLDRARYEDELASLYALSLEAFADNLYYAPIDLAGFLALYRPLHRIVDERFVQIAEHADGRPAGYLLAYPDPPASGGQPERLIAKTVATDPALRGLGLAATFFARMRERARDAGFTAIIHALYEAGNVSARLGRRHGGVPFRRYALYQMKP